MSFNLIPKRVLFSAVGLFIVVSAVLAAGFALYMTRPRDPGREEMAFVVPRGSNLTEVARKLEENGLINHKTLFVLGARLMGYSHRIKAGEYRINSGMAPLSLLRILGSGVSITYPVTIPEGFTVRQVAEVLERKGLANGARFLALARDNDLARRYGLPGPTLEGYLYPDTYLFERGQTAVSIIDRMVRRFFQVIGPLKEKIRDSGMTLGQVITLASMVEKETGKKEERPVIASVFLNRLKKGMRLESDPTVIYGIEEFNGNLTRKDLGRATPYNTYVIRGLPAGPIASPGEEAIRAVLYPAETDYLYFVSKNDGSHHFSRTLREHNRAVRIYQKRGRKGRRKTS